MSEEKTHNSNIIDPQGYRLNIGIIVINQNNEVLLAKRSNQNAWQFPQGGVQHGEKLTQALYRELEEELGLKSEDVHMRSSTPGFLKYRLPPGLVRKDNHPLCIGQKQKWYLLDMISPDTQIKLDAVSDPEFDGWAWVPYWYPLRYVISFKKDVYRRALFYFATQVFAKERDRILDPFVTQSFSKVKKGG